MVRRAIALLTALVAVGGCAAEERSPGAGAEPPAAGPASSSPSEPTSRKPRQPFEVDLPGTQRRWDPRTVDGLPHRCRVPDLPAVIDPPSDAPALADAPIAEALLAIGEGRQIRLRSTGGEWRSVPNPSGTPAFALSPSGARLFVLRLSSDAPLVVHDVATGRSHEVGHPEGFRDWDFTTWAWLDDETLLLDDAGGGWRVDATTGESERVPFPAAGPWRVDPAGAVVEAEDWGSPRVLTDWAAGTPRTVPMTRTGRLSSITADHGSVVGTSYDGHPYSVIVADRATLEPRWVLPVLDPEANYSNWALGVLVRQDDGTVLLRVSAVGRDVDGFRVVAWEPASGRLSLVTTYDGRGAFAFADGLLRRTDP